MSPRTQRILICLALLLVAFTLWWYLDRAIFALLFVVMLFLLSLQLVLHGVPPTEQLVVFRLGRPARAKGPGLVWLWPLIDTSVRVDLQRHSLTTDKLQCATSDNVHIGVSLGVEWFVDNPVRYVMSGPDSLNSALRSKLDSILRRVIARYPLDNVLTQTAHITQELTRSARDEMQGRGIDITELAIVGSISIPAEVEAAMHREAAAKRDGNAVRHKATAEAAALVTLQQVAANIDERALKLRYLTALEVLGAAESTKYVLSFDPNELLRSWAGQISNKQAGPEKKPDK